MAGGRRPAALISPVPAARKQSKRAKQDDLFDEEEDDSQQYTLAIINEIRGYVSAWRGLRNPTDWGVSPVTQRLLKYWREHEFGGVKPFFCQIEAVETAISFVTLLGAPPPPLRDPHPLLRG